MTQARLLNIGPATVSPEGQYLQLPLITDSLNPFSLCISHTDVSKLIALLAGLSADASQARMDAPPANPLRHDDLHPIPTSAIGYAAGASPDQAILVMVCPGLDLAFQIPRSTAARLLRDLIPRLEQAD